MGHEQDCPGKAVERELELLDRGHVEMVRGLVEDETVHAPGCEQRNQRTRTLTGRERRRVTLHVVGAEAELREQRACLFLVQVRGLRESR